jgi:hypothetical protein
MKRHITALFLCLVLFQTLYADSSPNTTITRAAIDIGMGGPKLQIAEVDVTTQKIVKILHTERYFVNFYEGTKNQNKLLSSEIMSQGLQAIKNAISVARSFQVDGIALLATASLRDASNGDEFARLIENETDIRVHIVDQSLEGRLAFLAVLSHVNVDAENLIVWDIGGGSIQFTGLAKNGELRVDCGEKGVGAFTDHVIAHLQGHSLDYCKTPNPMSAEDILQAKEYAYQLAQKVDQVFQQKLKNPNTQVVGAGSVFGYGIASLLEGKNLFSQEDIATCAYNLAGKTDADLGGGDFAFCEGTNAILVSGFMENLGIKQVNIVNINNADGAMIENSFWK